MQNRSIVFNGIILFLLFQLNFSCNSKKDWLKKDINLKENSNSEGKRNQFIPDWNLLKLDLNNEKLWIFESEDTIYYSKIVKFDSLYFLKNGKYESIDKRMYLDSSIKENIFRIAKNCINKPELNPKMKTCFAGHYLDIKLEYGATSISCSYSSVTDELFMKDKNLNSLFKYTFDIARKDKSVQSK